MPGDGAHDHRDAHQPRPASTHAGLESSSARDDLGRTPMRWNASTVPTQRRARRTRASRRGARTRARACARPRAAAVRGSAAAAGRTRGCRSAGAAPIRTAARCATRPRRRASRSRPRRRRAPRAATCGQAKRWRARRRRAPIAARRSGVEREVAQRLGERGRVAARDEHAVDAVAHDVAVAGDVGGDDRRAGRERLRQHHAEALAAERRRAQHVGALRARRCFSASSTRPSTVTPRSSSSIGSTSSRSAPTIVSSAGTCVAQRLEGAQQHRQALALDRLADERDAAAARAGARAAPARRRRAASTPLGIDRGSGRRRSAAPVQAAASETAIRTCRWLSSRRAPSRFATLFVTRFVE